jgi:hypothetical protein
LAFTASLAVVILAPRATAGMKDRGVTTREAPR